MKNSVLVFLFIAGLLLAVPAYSGQDVEITVKEGKLHGTVEVPSGETPCPAVVIISGSGPTDRDGNIPSMGIKNNSLKLLAESLAAKGIASVRFDKRGVGESVSAMTSEEDLRFETYIDDAVMWGKELQRDKRFNQVAIIGHSEGSLIGLAACQKMDTDAFITIAGAGVSGSELLLSQLKPKLPKKLFDDAATIIDSLNHGKMVDSVPPDLNTLFRKSVQPYIISWFRYTPEKEIAKLKVPILVVNGSSDIQVGMEHAVALAKSNRHARLVSIRGMNHVLKKVSGSLREQLPSYGDPTLPIAEELVEEITSFIKWAGSEQPNRVAGGF